MKNVHYIALIVMMLAAAPAQVQGQQQGVRSGAAAQGRISGTIIDGATKDPLAAATVALWTAADSALVTGAVSLADGRFELEQLRPGAYYLQVSFIGYVTTTVEAVTLRPGALTADVGAVLLQPDTALLDEIEVSADRAFMQVEVDRTVYNTKDQLVAVGGSASDVLENIPSVEVDIDGNISLRGNQNVAILINGRPSPVQGDALAGYLQGLSGESIERIEVMPNPSARYEPDGMAGILNIVLKKTTERNLSGGVTTSAGTQGDYSATGNINLQQGRVGVFSSYGFRNSNRDATSDRYRENRYSDPLTILDQDEISTRTSFSHSLNTTLDYSLSDRNTLTFGSMFSTRPSESDNRNDYYERDAVQALVDRYDRLSADRRTGLSTDHTLAFRRVLEPSKHEFVAELRYNTSRSDQTSTFTEQGLTADLAAPTLRELQANQVDQGTYRTSAQVDYMRPLDIGAGGKMEAGFKSSLQQLDNTFYSETMDAAIGTFVPDVNLNNAFIHDEQVHAAYGIYGQDLGAFDLQVGLRAEQALTSFALETTGEAFDNNYFSLFPSAFVTYALTDTRQLKASYSKRIRRPGARQLNPFDSYDDPLNRRVGNPYLQPEYIHAFEAGLTQFTERTSLTLTPYFRRTVNVMQRWLTVNDQGVTTQTFENFDNSDSYGMEAIGTFQLRGRFNAYGSFNAYRVVTDGSSVDADASNNAFGWTTRANATYTVRPGLSLQLSYFYRAPIDIAGGRINSFSSANIALRQQLFDGQGSLSVRMSDVFDTMGFSLYREDPNLYLQTNRKWASRSAFVSFTYNFGKQSRRNRNNDEGEEAGNMGGGDIEF